MRGLAISASFHFSTLENAPTVERTATARSVELSTQGQMYIRFATFVCHETIRSALVQHALPSEIRRHFSTIGFVALPQHP